VIIGTCKKRVNQTPSASKRKIKVKQKGSKMTTKLRKIAKSSFALAVVLLGSTITLATKTVVPANALSKSDINHTNSVQLAKLVEGGGTPETPIQNEGTPETPTQDTLERPTQNENQVRTVDWYMQQAGLPKSAELGQERWINACDVRAQQGAVTFNSGRTETCTYQYDKPGWQILEYQIDVLENKHGRGSYKGDIIAKDGNFTVNEQQIGDKWKVAIELAIKYKDIEAKRKLELEHERNLQLIRSYSSNKNTFFLSATANGGLARKSVIHVKGKIKVIRLQ
jgi:hypothetical protein